MATSLQRVDAFMAARREGFAEDVRSWDFLRHEHRWRGALRGNARKIAVSPRHERRAGLGAQLVGFLPGLLRETACIFYARPRRASRAVDTAWCVLARASEKAPGSSVAAVCRDAGADAFGHAAE
jgi:hypothetical protein